LIPIQFLEFSCSKPDTRRILDKYEDSTLLTEGIYLGMNFNFNGEELTPRVYDSLSDFLD
jgi:hypothetical protein